MSPTDDGHLRKRPNADKHSTSPSPAACPPAAVPRSTSRSVSTALFGFISLAISTYLLSTKLFFSHQALHASYALCAPDGAHIHTVDPSNPRVQCLVVHDSHFIFTGSLDHVRSRWAASFPGRLQVRFIKPGQIVVPGLSDSHVHVLEYGATQVMPLEGTRDIHETVERIEAYVLADPDILADTSKPIEGWGWDHTKWSPEHWPTYHAFEASDVLSGRPIILQSKDGHALWVSKTVIDSMGDIPEEIEGGMIMHDADGQPTGVFLDKAQDLVPRVKPTFKELHKRFISTVKDAHAVGLTSVHDAGFDPLSLQFFKREAEAGPLPIRIYGMKHFDETSDYWGDAFEKIILQNRLSVRSVKVFADGALRSGGAALYEPYTDNPETRGSMRIAPETLNDVVPRFMKDGWQVNVHAIGDRANGIVLDAFEAALTGANVSALRPRLEHAQILAEKDMARFGDLGVIASVQPTHAISDMWFGETRLGPERVKGLYAFRSIIDHGARITLGSDFPVEDMNPLTGFYAAITRVSFEGTSPHGPGGWFPEQRMTRAEALKGMTLDPAYASFTEHLLGSIAPGKLADFVVFDRDVMTVPPPQILDARAVATVIDGRPVFGAI
ncbi:amidohydrolase family-domain-containing protein [Epithele typhae]|uniref:amidohydrolase family-domain-containing protein n=1 Tax=Epithele typhae TaxID=378194 RepID=UPI0020079F06|nr:amidohydrolase family-domain-containing protein [Epithele typhae]KAH9913457.1 amidohydrolase family-domain-containing protein [Epithele typhae]